MKRFTFYVLLICIIWQIAFFVYAPKQAYMQGVLESWYASHGLVYYKDIANAYLPFLKFVMYFFHSVFGYSLSFSALLSPIFTIFILVLLYITGKKYLKGISQVVPAVFYIIWNTYLGGNLFSATSFLGFLLLVAFFCFNSWWEKPTKTKSFAAGLVFSFSVLTMQIVAPFIAVLFAGIFIKGIKKKKINYLLFFCMGIGLPLLAVILWVLKNNILNEFLYWNVFYYFNGYPYATLSKDLPTVLIFLAVHSPLIIFILYKRNFITALAVVALLISFWFAVFHPMRFQISLPIIALLFGLGLEDYLKSKRYSLKGFLVGIVFGLNILATVLYIYPYFWVSFSSKNVNRLVSEIYPGDPMYDSVNWVKANTPKSANIFVTGDTYFYLAAERLPANYRNALGFEPMLFEPLDKFKQELISKPPDFWVIDERMFLTYSNWKADDLSDLIKKFLACQKLMVRFDYWAIYQKNEVNPSCSGT